MRRYEQVVHRQEGEIRLDQSMRGFLDDITGETADELERSQQKYMRLLYGSAGVGILVLVYGIFHYRMMKEKGWI